MFHSHPGHTLKAATTRVPVAVRKPRLSSSVACVACGETDRSVMRRRGQMNAPDRCRPC